MIKNFSYRNPWPVPLLLAIFMSGPYAYACLWPAGRIQVGKRIKIEGVSAPDFAKSLISHEGRAYWEKVLADLEGQRKDYPFIENRNNLAVSLIHLGRVKEAIPILEELERKHPGKYFTAANLGTAYELSGDNQKAMDWIKEGVNRNKDSHFGTEWLHVKILEAKLAMEKDPDWFRKHSVLGADFRARENTRQPQRLATDHLGQQKSLAETEEALIYQLHERLEFVKPPDPIVADLLFDLGNVLALTRTEEHAKAIHELALSYGPKHGDLVRSRLADESRATQRSPSRNYLFYGSLVAGALLAIAGFYVFIRRRKLHQRRI